MKKSIGAIAAILGILKADCAYIPIDVESPRQRLVSILRSAGSGLVLVDDHSQGVFEELLGEAEYSLLNVTKLNPGNTATPVRRNLSIDIAYIIFTSGSTGTPRGC